MHITALTSWVFISLSTAPVTTAFAPTLESTICKEKIPLSSLHMSIPNAADTLTSGLASMARLPFGTVVSSPPSSEDIPRIVALYDMEGSTDCRLVRERISELDLCVENIIPGAEGSRAVKDKGFEFYVGESATIPRMIVEDKIRGMLTYEGVEDILGYFTDEFGPRAPIIDDTEEEIKKTVVEGLVALSKPLPSLLRFGRGSKIAGCCLSYRSMQPLVSVPYKNALQDIENVLNYIIELTSSMKLY
jgi:hypothetical protein